MTLGPTDPSGDDAALEGLRHLCELIHRPTRRRLDAALAVDWTHHRAIRDVIDGETTPTLVSTRMQEFLRRVCDDLGPSHPSTAATLSGLDVVRLHLLDGLSWDAITAERMEKGVPVSARTLRTRQREGLQAILDAVRDTGDEASSAAPPEIRGEAKAPRAPLALGALVVVLAALALSQLSRDTTPPGVDELSAHHVGYAIPILEGSHVLPAPLPPIELPLPGQRVSWAMVVPRHDRYALLFAVWPSPTTSARTILWDPWARETLWTYEFTATREEILTHATLEEASVTSPFWPTAFVYGTTESNFEDRVLVSWIQAYSPCFVTAINLDDGREVGRYAHPGRLEGGIAADIDADGRPEAIFCGQDNVLDRGVLAVLDAVAVHGAASTVQWQDPAGSEDALARVVLPDLPTFRQAFGAERFTAVLPESGGFDPQRGSLVVQAMGSHRADRYTAYQVQLGRDLRPRPDVDMVVGEGELQSWRRLGLTPPTPRQILDQVEVLGDWPPRRDGAGPTLVPATLRTN